MTKDRLENDDEFLIWCMCMRLNSINSFFFNQFKIINIYNNYYNLALRRFVIFWYRRGYGTYDGRIINDTTSFGGRYTRSIAKTYFRTVNGRRILRKLYIVIVDIDTDRTISITRPGNYVITSLNITYIYILRIRYNNFRVKHLVFYYIVGRATELEMLLTNVLLRRQHKKTR